MPPPLEVTKEDPPTLSLFPESPAEALVEKIDRLLARARISHGKRETSTGDKFGDNQFVAAVRDLVDRYRIEQRGRK